MRAAGLRNRASPADGVPFARQFERLALHQGNRGLEGTETVVAVCGPVGGFCGKPTTQRPCPRISSGESGTPCLIFSIWAGWSTGAGAKPFGLWRSSAYTEWYDSYPCDEFMVVLEGEVTIESDSFCATYGPGAAFLIPKGFQGYWRQPVAMVKYYAIVE